MKNQWLVARGQWPEKLAGEALLERDCPAPLTVHTLAASSSLATDHCSPATASRRGISLMEVLISMFILTVGLLGVAALIPAGRHELVEAAKLDNAAMVGRAAFRDMQVRGFLNPATWNRRPTTPATPMYDPTATVGQYFTITNTSGGYTPSQRVAYCLDPLGQTIPGVTTFVFPYGIGASDPPGLARIVPFTTASLAESRAAYDSVFRSSFDQILEPNATNADFPPSPKWFGGNLKRMSDGNYSWMATIISDPSRPAINSDVTVSVAVFYKRDMSQPGAGEWRATAKNTTIFPITNGGELIVDNLPTDLSGKMKLLKPGQWIMLAGVKDVPSGASTVRRHYYGWYKVLSAAPFDTGLNGQRVTINGQDWTCDNSVLPVQVWIIDNIVNVYEKQLPLELQ